MDKYEFRNEGNSYFNGSDVVATRVRDGREVTINSKDRYLAVNVKDHETGYGFLYSVPEDVKAMAEELNRANASRMDDDPYERQWTDILYSYAQERFWSDANYLAEDAGQRGVGSTGRSGGWCVIEGMPSDEAYDLILGIEDWSDEDKAEYADEYEDKLERRADLLNLLIEIEDLIPDARDYWYSMIREEFAELEVEREACLIRGTD